MIVELFFGLLLSSDGSTAKFQYSQPLPRLMASTGEILKDPRLFVLSGNGSAIWHDPSSPTGPYPSIFDVKQSEWQDTLMSCCFDGRRIVFGQHKDVEPVINGSSGQVLLPGHEFAQEWKASPSLGGITYATRGVWKGLALDQWLPPTVVFEFDWSRPRSLVTPSWQSPKSEKAKMVHGMRSIQQVGAKSFVLVGYDTFAPKTSKRVPRFLYLYDTDKIKELWRGHDGWRVTVGRWPQLSPSPFLITSSSQGEVTLRELRNGSTIIKSRKRFASKDWLISNAVPYRNFVVVQLQSSDSRKPTSYRIVFCDPKTLRTVGTHTGERLSGWTYDGRKLLLVPVDKAGIPRLVSGEVTFSSSGSVKR